MKQRPEVDLMAGLLAFCFIVFAAMLAGKFVAALLIEGWPK